MPTYKVTRGSADFLKRPNRQCFNSFKPGSGRLEGQAKALAQKAERQEQRGALKVEKRPPEMDLEPVREELLFAVGARDLVWEAVLAKLVFHNRISGEYHIGLTQVLNARLPLVAMIDHHLDISQK